LLSGQMGSEQEQKGEAEAAQKCAQAADGQLTDMHFLRIAELAK
jgi:hypothetical protein